MKLPMNLLVGLAWFAGLAWILYGGGTLPLGARIAVVAGGALGYMLVAWLATARERRRRLERNRIHCAERGLEFSAEASIDDVFHDAGLFRHDRVRIEQLARGTYDETEADVFDLSYEATSGGGGEGGTTTHTVVQTVASIPCPGGEGLRCGAWPLRGLEGGLLRFLGMTPTAEASPHSHAGDQALAEWFGQSYTFGWGDESNREQAERLLNGSFLHWLRHHDHLAFEIADRRLLVWTPGRVVDSTARDELVNEATELAVHLRQGSEAEAPLVALVPPAVTSARDLLWHMAVSAFGSWAIAAIVAMSGFFGAAATGVMERVHPPTFVVGLMSVTIVVWVTAGVFIHRRCARVARPRDS